jgi:carbamoyltransferase
MLVNTSFNVKGEPIVNTPEEAYLCFMNTGMDILVINNYIFFKEKQPALADEWQQREFEDD